MTKDQKPVVELDEILKQLGSFGKFNILNYALLLFPIFLAGAYGSVFIFEAQDIDYRCQISECEDLQNETSWLHFAIPEGKKSLSRCKRYAAIPNATAAGTCNADSFNTSLVEACDTLVYSDEDSAVKDFNLGCQDWKRTLVGTVRNAGLFISLPLTGVISDKYGRKVALSIASLMNGILGLSRSFSPTYIMMLVFEFLEAGLGAGVNSTAFVLAMELVRPKGRVLGNTLINFVYVFGLIALAGLKWWLHSWRNMLRVLYTPAFFIFSYIWIMNESVRWLLSKGRSEEAVAILKKAAKMNKVEIDEELLVPLFELEKITKTDEVKENCLEPVKEKQDSLFMKVLKSSIIRKRVFVCSFLWITCTFVYYGLSINSVSLAGNKYVNFMLVAAVEIPANVACLLTLDRFGRKKTLISMYILSAFLCIGLSFIPKNLKLVALIVYLSGKFSITVAYSSVYIYVSEVFPTNVRQSLLAVCSAVGRVGSMLAPLTPLLAIYNQNLPTIFFGGMALIASGMVLMLPETLNAPLPDTIEEAEGLSLKKPQESA